MAGGQPVKLGLAGEPAAFLPSYDTRAGHERDQRDRRCFRVLLLLSIK